MAETTRWTPTPAPGHVAISDRVHRIFSSQTITPMELRIAGLVAIEWWLMDHLWFVGTLLQWW